MKSKLPCTSIYNEYTEDLNFKASIALFERTNRNLDFYNGRQWREEISPIVARPVQNVISPLIDTKCALIRETPVKIVISASDTSDTSNDSIEMERREIAELWTDKIAQVQERLQFDKFCTDGIIQAATTGQYAIYTYWDPSIVTRNDVKGDINIRAIPLTNIHYANQYSDDIQNQPWIMISYREHIDNVKKMAEQNGIDETFIVPDSTNMYEAQTNWQTVTDPDRCTVIIKFHKVKNKVHYTLATKHTVLKTEETKLKNYPVSIFNYKPQLNSAYSLGDLEQCIQNQRAINRSLATVLESMMLTGLPIMRVKKAGAEGVSNKPGSIIYVNNTDDINWLIPPQASYDFKLYIETLTTGIEKMLGLNDIVMGRKSIDNTSYFLAVRETSLSSLDNYKSRYYTFLEDTTRIWVDYFTSYYNTPRLTTINNDGKKTLVEIKGDEYKDIEYSYKIDIGPNIMYSQMSEISNLSGLLDRQIIDASEFVDLLPDNFITSMSKLRDLTKKKLEAQNTIANTQDVVNEQMESLPEEDKELLANPDVINNILANMDNKNNEQL